MKSQVKIITSTNARMDCNMLQERICCNAQWEINQIAVAKLEKLRKLSDILYQYAVRPVCTVHVKRENDLRPCRRNARKIQIKINCVKKRFCRKRCMIWEIYLEEILFWRR